MKKVNLFGLIIWRNLWQFISRNFILYTGFHHEYVRLCFLILLFMHVRLPFWPYMKILGICWLMVPHFNGACYVYECLFRPCLSVNPRVVIKYLIKPKENPSLSAESFLSVGDRYVKVNGSEALEKLIDSKVSLFSLSLSVFFLYVVVTLSFALVQAYKAENRC